MEGRRTGGTYSGELSRPSHGKGGIGPDRMAYGSSQPIFPATCASLDLKIQQEVQRHADIRTTMNIYTRAVPTALREANNKVVRLVLSAQVAWA